MSLPTLNCLKKKLQFDLFKANVRFKHLKKFKVFKFKIKRRRFRRLKHKTNFFLFHNVFKYWIQDFYLNKKFLKFEYLFAISSWTCIAYNFEYLNKNRIGFANTLFSVCALTKSSYRKISYFLSFFGLFSQFKQHTLSIISAIEPQDVLEFSTIKLSSQTPFFYYGQHQLFQPLTLSAAITHFNLVFNLNLQIQFALLLHNFYNILIILFFSLKFCWNSLNLIDL